MRRFDKHKHWTDSQLMEALRQDDNRSFEVLYERYAPMLLKFVGQMLKDSLRAEDVVQNVFIKLYSLRKTFDSGCNVRSFLFVCAKNEVLNILKSKWVSGAEPITAAPDLPDLENQEDALIRSERRDALSEGISSLPQRRRQVLEMRLDDDRSNEDIARRMALSVRTVEKHIELATRDLRRKLN